MDNKKINILFSSFPDYSGNPKALYEYINSNYKDKFNLLWVFYSENTMDIFKNLNREINCVLFKSNDYYNVIRQIDIIFDTNGCLAPEKLENQIYVNLWHGASPKKKGYLLNRENFAPQDDDYYSNMHLVTDYIVVPSEFSRLVFSSAFDINIQRVISLGCSRDDYLNSCNGKDILSNILKIDLNKYNKILFYLPTFRTGCNRQDSYNIWENNLLDLDNYNENELYKFLEDNNYLLVVKKHPSEEAHVINTDCKNIIVLNEEQLTNNLITIYEVLNSADLLIADYSSIYVEYSLLERPILFLHKNFEEYKCNRGIILNNIDFWTPGPQVTKIKNFIIEIEKLLKDSSYYQKERIEFKNIMFGNNCNNICKKTFEFFFNSKTFKLNCAPFITPEKNNIKNLQVLQENYSNLQGNYNDLQEKYNNLQNTFNSFKEFSKSTEEELRTNISNLTKELQLIYNSKSWKILSVFQKKKKNCKGD